MDEMNEPRTRICDWAPREEVSPLAAAGTGFLRARLKEVSFAHSILPPKPVEAPPMLSEGFAKIAEEIVTGMGVPQEFVFGSTTVASARVLQDHVDQRLRGYALGLDPELADRR